MINISAATYGIDTLEEINTNHCPGCYPELDVRLIRNGSKLLMLIGVDPEIKGLIVAFRGSDNAKNWFVDDFRIYPQKFDDIPACKGCRVHRGFYKAMQAIREDFGFNISDIVDGFLAIPKYKDYTIFFTGHSLGGALANLAAIYAENNTDYKLPAQVYTFGQPRVGDKDYAKYYNSKIPHDFRVIHRKDIVPHKPPSMMFYVHTGYEIWYRDGMEAPYLACKGDSNKCSNSLGYTSLSYRISDHSSKHYLNLKADHELTTFLNAEHEYEIGEDLQKIEEAEPEDIAYLESGDWSDVTEL